MRRMTGLAIISILVGSCGGSATTDTTEAGVPSAATQTTSVAVATTSAVAAGSGELRDDIPAPCSLATAEEVGGLLGAEIEAGETMGGECSYEAVNDSELSLFLTAGAFPLPTEECATWIPSEPLFEEETVEPAPEYGDHATIVTAEFRTDYFVCANGAAVTVEMLGPESMTAAEQKGVAAGVLELILGRL